jgi:hypothetical protein
MSKAFMNNNLEYINKYISERRSRNENDIFALLLEYNINIVLRRFDDSIGNIIKMFDLIKMNEYPCNKYNITIIYDMVQTFESVYQNYFLNPAKDNLEKPTLGMTCLDISYLLELNNCL